MLSKIPWPVHTAPTGRKRRFYCKLNGVVDYGVNVLTFFYFENQSVGRRRAHGGSVRVAKRALESRCAPVRGCARRLLRAPRLHFAATTM
jgi:hypothetical protein